SRIRKTKGPGNGGGHFRRVANCGEIDKPDPVGEGVAESLSHLACQPGLADPGRAREGQEPGRAIREQLAKDLQLLVPSEKRRRLWGGQDDVATDRRAVDR